MGACGPERRERSAKLHTTGSSEKNREMSCKRGKGKKRGGAMPMRYIHKVGLKHGVGMNLRGGSTQKKKKRKNTISFRGINQATY